MASDPEFDRLDALLTQGEARIARIIRAAVAAAQDELDIGVLADLLSTGRVEDALDLLMTMTRQIAAAPSTVFITAGQSTAQMLASAGVVSIAFDQVNQRAVDIMRASQLDKIQQFSAEQRRAVNTVLTDGIRDGIGPVAQARNFRNVIGLTDAQAKSVQKYRRILEGVGTDSAELKAALVQTDKGLVIDRKLRDGRFDGKIRQAIRNSEKLTAPEIERMTARYAERYVKYRAEVIARTEALRAVHEGANEAWQQAIDDGKVEASEVTQTWRSAGDNRVRESHMKLNGQERPIGGTWEGDYGTLRYPGDPDAPPAEIIQCRCILVRRIPAMK